MNNNQPIENIDLNETQIDILDDEPIISDFCELIQTTLEDEKNEVILNESLPNSNKFNVIDDPTSIDTDPIIDCTHFLFDPRAIAEFARQIQDSEFFLNLSIPNWEIPTFAPIRIESIKTTSANDSGTKKKIGKKAKTKNFLNEFPINFDQEIRRLGCKSRYAFCEMTGISKSNVSNITKMQKGDRPWKGIVREAYERLMMKNINII